MSTYGLTDAGFIPKRLVDIKAELEAEYRSAFGPAINLDARSPLGQMIGIHSEREADIWEEMEVVYNSRYPDNAQGASLDEVVSITNVTRLDATYSHVTGRISGTNATTVPIGFIASVAGDPTARFITTESGVITGGYVDLLFQAESTGPTESPSGTLTVIETPLSGVTSVTNALDAVVGRNTETDDALRIRRLQSLNRPGTATVNGIINALLNVTDVVQAAVIENDTDITDVGGRPPHSFESVVLGGTDADVAEAIFMAKGAGIQTYGTTTVVVTDSQGFTHSISFSRPTGVTVYLEITVTPNLDPNEGAVYPANGDDAINAAIMAFTGAAGELGHDVVLSKLYTPINTVAGVFGVAIRVSINGSSWQTTNLIIAANAVAEFATARITVIS